MLYASEECWQTGQWTDECICEFCAHKGECSGAEDNDNED